MKKAIILSSLLSILFIVACNSNQNHQPVDDNKETTKLAVTNDSTRIIYFAGGCFWGTEHFFQQINGVTTTEVGFANGHTDHPTYQEVVRENTGYAETVKVTYNPQKVDLNLLLDLYFLTIDPTSINRQGNDIGDQYRTGIYYTLDNQLPVINQRLKKEALKQIKPIAVEVAPLTKYYKAEDYHQDYLNKNPGGYCHISPALFKVAQEANRDHK